MYSGEHCLGGGGGGGGGGSGRGGTTASSGNEADEWLRGGRITRAHGPSSVLTKYGGETPGLPGDGADGRGVTYGDFGLCRSEISISGLCE